MSNFKITEDGMRVYEQGGKRDSNEGKIRPDLIPHECLERLGKLYRDGAKHYGIDNWRKLPYDAFRESLSRHYVSVMLSRKDEDHLAALVFNAFGMMMTEGFAFDESVDIALFKEAYDDEDD